MLATYQAKWENNQIHWIDTPPPANAILELAVTVLPTAIEQPKHTPPPELKGVMTFDDSIWDSDEMLAEWTPNFPCMMN